MAVTVAKTKGMLYGSEKVVVALGEEQHSADHLYNNTPDQHNHHIHGHKN